MLQLTLRTRDLRDAIGVTLLLVGLTACSDTPDGETTGGQECSIDGRTLRVGARATIQGDDGCEQCTCAAGATLTCTPTRCAGEPEPDASLPTPDTTPEDSGTDGDDLPEADATPVTPDVADEPPPFDSSVNDCACIPGVGPDAEVLAFAMGICAPTLQGATRTGESAQFSVVRDYFGVTPPTGSCMAVLSTGRADQAPETGTPFAPQGAQPGTMFDENRTFANPRPAGGPGVYDLATLTLELRPPPNARGLEFRFMFLSSEWPEYLCQEFNDTFLAVLESTANEGGRPANISFDAARNEVSVNIGFFEGPAEWTTDLARTPFGLQPPPPPIALPFPLPGLAADQCPSALFRGGCSLPDYCDDGSDLNFIGSGTGWLRSAAPVNPDEDIVRITFTIHDEGDAAYDSLVLLEGFRWLSFTPVVETEKL